MHEPDPPQSSKKKWVLLSILALAVVLVAAAALLLLRPKNKKGDDVSTQKSSQLTSAASSSIDAETSSWKTYSDKLITLKYPDGWSIKQNQYVGGGNFNITPPGDPSSTGTGGYLGEDDSTDNAKTNDSKTYWQRAYNSDGSNKIIAENSDSVNGYDTYNVESKDSIGSTTYSVVGKAGVKITIYYPTNDKSNDTYETIVKTLRFN